MVVVYEKNYNITHTIYLICLNVVSNLSFQFADIISQRTLKMTQKFSALERKIKSLWNKGSHSPNRVHDV